MEISHLTSFHFNSDKKGNFVNRNLFMKVEISVCNYYTSICLISMLLCLQGAGLWTSHGRYPVVNKPLKVACSRQAFLDELWQTGLGRWLVDCRQAWEGGL